MYVARGISIPSKLSPTGQGMGRFLLHHAERDVGDPASFVSFGALVEVPVSHCRGGLIVEFPKECKCVPIEVVEGLGHSSPSFLGVGPKRPLVPTGPVDQLTALDGESSPPRHCPPPSPSGADRAGGFPATGQKVGALRPTTVEVAVGEEWWWNHPSFLAARRWWGSPVGPHLLSPETATGMPPPPLLVVPPRLRHPPWVIFLIQTPFFLTK
ncbi:hypothetical protein Sjap_020369 [Stephania japonica]|uniref:Uncharacterized protein n=1 Tax=Stephania japonica TaxID=461633 RepID=A0AAP0F392_9MAGN